MRGELTSVTPKNVAEVRNVVRQWLDKRGKPDAPVSFGISKVLSDYTVETTFQKLSDSLTKIEISHYYSTPTLKAKLLNLVAKGKIARETHATLTAIKAAIEATRHSD